MVSTVADDATSRASRRALPADAGCDGRVIEDTIGVLTNVPTPPCPIPTRMPSVGTFIPQRFGGGDMGVGTQTGNTDCEEIVMAGEMDQAKGRVKEAAGALTDDQGLKNEG